MNKAMIVSVGTGEGVESGIIKSINSGHPDFVFFVVTKESQAKILPLVLEQINAKTEKRVLEDENDFGRIKESCQNWIKEIKKDYQEITVDFTSGTKPMSVGLILAAVEEEIANFSYVYGERDKKTGRAITGSERVLEISANKIFAEKALARAISLFNRYDFDACEEVVREIVSLYREESFQKKCNVLLKLNQMYSLWDKFETKKTFEKMRKISDEDVAMLGIKGAFTNNKEILAKENKEFFSAERIIDLYQNGKRRGEIERKYDDAVCRLYRLLEYIGQFFIGRRGLWREKCGRPQTDDLDINRLERPELKEKYGQYRDKKDNKVKLSLFSSFRLLKDLEEQAGIEFFENEEGFKKLLHIRNYSILEHGFEPVSSENYTECVRIIEDFARKIIPDFERNLEKARFPKIVF